VSAPGALGIDVGSSNVKVALVDGDGALAGWAERPLTTVRDGDRAEQDADALWDAVIDAIGEVASGAPAIGAIGVCSQYSSIVPVGADLRPTAAMVMYWDQRGTDHSWAIMQRHPGAFETFVDRHGIPPIGSGLSLGHLLHFQLDRPEVHAATAHYLEPMDYVVARLTGRVTATQATMFMAQVCDNRTVGVTAYDDELLRLAGLEADRLPPLLAVDGVAGEAVGDLAGAEVRVGMNDSHAGALAAGAFAPGRAGLAIGTTAVLLDTVADKRVDLEAELVSMPSTVPGRYLAWAENGIAGKAVEHVLSLLDGSFAELEGALVASAPGAGGALFLPWLAGSIAPSADRNARGGFLNLSLDTTREDLVRAMVEGTAHNLAWLLPAVERFTGQSIGELGFFGGAARSPGWAQVLADVLGRPVATLADAEVAAAAAVARHALGSPPDARPAVSVTYEPRPDLAARYEDAQGRFEATFGALSRLRESRHGNGE
jgi:sugar (pentulose or hexulose) kinase